MATTLGGVTLPPHIVWEDKYKWSPVLQEVKTTLGGRPVVFAASLLAGRRITLVAYSDQGWLTKAQVDSVRALAAVAGAQYAFSIGEGATLESYTVVFRHEEPPAVEFDPLIPRGVPLDGDYFVGRIKLLVV
jgi:hypothetical protein